ncbi:SDR family oxidoreductase [Salinibacterium sp. M195]|uniref:SDR family NAD(P)-dependent oxidoreductase n=1 Tax=Salinibacterium sp. M195 TaxID=2583374 RepID=UPI001C62BCEC|nr:SDR family oxidoreductase [Salinibacterium sp. M195]QYH35765.1 SDR family oxidoreductase [Salinibacterium sp. M195]
MATRSSRSPTGTALVTGATSGIGAEFARQLAHSGFDVVLVARNSARLEAMAAELRDTAGITVEVISADLTSTTERDLVENRLKSATNPITYLVNNAGYGLPQEFDTNSVDDEARMLELLATVPMRLSHAVLGGMLARGAGTVLTVASIAGEAPLGLYAAAKAWPLSFSRWANAHYRGRGVTFTALAPGFVRTDFHARLGIEREAMAPKWMWLEAEFVVRSALRSAAHGRAVSIPSVRYKFLWAAMNIAQPLVLFFVARASRASNASAR